MTDRWGARTPSFSILHRRHLTCLPARSRVSCTAPGGSFAQRQKDACYLPPMASSRERAQCRPERSGVMGMTETTTSSQEVLETYRRHVLHPWSVQAEINPLVIVGGKGATLWDAEGQRFIDFSAQLANVSVGYQEPRVVEALVHQARELCYVSGLHAHLLTAE